MVDFSLKDAGSNWERGWVKKEIDYGYAISIHKSQGSTFKNIFIDARNVCYVKSDIKIPRVNTINNPYAISLRNRLLYTGLSRASNIVYIYI
jgi:ATP-dependent exoDNAse (exonuclease V) alpha subunit